MPNTPITSREYKLLLNVDRFKDREQGVATFFNLVAFLTARELDLKPATEVERRFTSYLDTPEMALHQRGFALRLREQVSPKINFQVNLKCRDSDRYISAAKNVSAPGQDKPKFEEDILPPFVSKFSNSQSVKSKTKPDLSSFGKLTALFPGLKDLNLEENSAIVPVNAFRVTEIVRDLCEIPFIAGKPVEASMSFWYLKDSETEWPLIAEFSFSYKAVENPDGSVEDFPAETVEGAHRLFSALQKHDGWLNLNGTTKTAFALEA